MRKADLVLAVIAVVAVAATAVAGLSGDRWTHERTLRFASHQSDLSPTDLQPANGAGAHFNWTIPDNATATNLTVTLYFSGQAIRGGSATVSVRMTTPDGKGQPPVTQSWAIPQGSTTGQTTLNVSAMWAMMPSEFRDTTSEGHERHWTKPLEVVVLVEQPSDVPLARYAFTASALGTVSTYAAV
ncbi:MAG: hypothetical protein QOJ26_1682 [Thermoplasmata archaeon]|jgi:hypothetical protein|nr:hypothetical protein [Thermoplasmata archaeon]MEA3166808.1 hypothetical protein [Thermoplasmata archaeon]